jgi:hypothetical protein
MGSELILPAPPSRPPRCGWPLWPAACCSIGGGMIKLGGGSTWAAVAVAAGPSALYAMLYSVFTLGYLAAVARHLCARADGQRAMERLIITSANSVVTILTFDAGAAAPPGSAARPG